jgi:hypothetical protein
VPLQFLHLTHCQFHTDTLLLDTGSSNTWIGANKAYEKTSTSKDTGGQFVSACFYVAHIFVEPFLVYHIRRSELRFWRGIHGHRNA